MLNITHNEKINCVRLVEFVVISLSITYNTYIKSLVSYYNRSLSLTKIVIIIYE